MTTTPHPYAHILRAIADGETIQLHGATPCTWRDLTAGGALELIASGTYEQQGIRVKPRTIRIGEYDVPEPLRVMPPEGTPVYWPGFGPDSGDDHTERTEVGYYPTMLPALLRQRLLHLTAEAASAHAAALISFTDTTTP